MKRLTTRQAFLSVMIALSVIVVLFPAVEARSSKAEITFGDSDDIVSPGTDVDAHVWIRDADANKTYTLRFVHAAGGPAVIDQGGVVGGQFTGVRDEEGDLGPLTVRLIVPLGSPHGSATISAMVDVEDEDPLPLATRILKIGDAGDPIGSAVLEPSTEKHEDGGERISTSLKRGKTAYLKLTTKNSLRKPTNDGDVKSVLIVATHGILGREAQTPSADHEHLLRYEDGTANDADAVVRFTLKPIGTDATHIDLYAIVIGEDGFTNSNTLALNFAGAPAELLATEPSGNLADANGEVRIVISGRDSVGNLTEVRASNIKAEVSGGPEDANLSRLRVSDQQCKKDEVDCETDQVVVLVKTTSSKPAHGHYTIGVELTNTPTPVETSAEIVVVGEAVFLSLELYKSTDPGAELTFGKDPRGLLFYVPGQGEDEELIVAEGEVVIAAVVLRDEFGELVAASSSAVEDDGVTFDSLGSLHLLPLTSGEREIQRGVATARFLVTGMSGHALLVASSNDLHDLVRLIPAAENVRGAAGLTSKTADDLSVWIAPNSTPISELLTDLESRGVQAIFLWLHREQRWQQYVAPEAEGEGVSSVRDFQVRTGNILWLGSSPTSLPPLILPRGSE